MFISMDDARALRRAELTLHRWHELECGDSVQGRGFNVSFAIERDETESGDGLPYMVRHVTHFGISTSYTTTDRRRIPDREAGAIRRVKEVCDRLGLFFYVQTDPRGAALYVSNEQLTDRNYTNGVCCAM